MPVPAVKFVSASGLVNMFASLDEKEKVSAVCQGFVGKGIAGEAVLLFSRTDYEGIAELMNYEGEVTESVRDELLMDIGSVMIGAFLKGFADQIDVSFSQGIPMVIGTEKKISDELCRQTPAWNQVLAIELRCEIEARDIRCNLLMLFTEDSIGPLNDVVEILAG